MSIPLLEVGGLTLSASHGTILKDLSFEVHPGEIVALTGKSGSGKTSIALAILGLLPPGIRLQSGLIRWRPDHHQEYTLPGAEGAWPGLRGTHIGYTQQDAFGAFDPVLRMGEQMIMVIGERSAIQPEEAKHALRMKLEEVGLHDIDQLLNSYPHQLSGGQLQRCQIAMSIVIQPRLLISDEPTSAIDKINQLELLEVFAMLRDRYDMGILCITHEEAVVRHLADREIRLGVIDHEIPLPEPVLSPRESVKQEPVLEVKGLTYQHTYGGVMYKKGATIGPVDFKVFPSKCLGIVGESGSGKSTLAQLLVGLFHPMAGQVKFRGKEIDYTRLGEIRGLREHIQLVMQDGRGALHPHLTVRQLLTEVVPSRSAQEDELGALLAQSLKEVGLPSDVLDRKSSRLSGGECLRICIARALWLRPSLLICDESTSALDGPTRDGVIALLRQLMDSRGMALLFISHDERLIRGVAHDIVVLADGKVVETGPAQEVIRYPTHPVTRKIFTTHATLHSKKRL